MLIRLLVSLRSADHNTVLLVPVYKTILKRVRPQTKNISLWSEESTASLQGCLECTDWDVFYDSCSTIDELTDVISNYISFCEEMLIPRKTIKIFPNNKPWFTNSLKALMNERCIAFHEGNLAKKLELQKEIKIEVRRAKLNYKKKLEEQLSMNNLGSVWKGMTLITGTKGCEIKKVQLPEYDSNSQLAEDINKFYL